MKKFLLISFLLISPFSFSQELEQSATIVKEAFPEDYDGIKKFAVNKWEDNHRMVLHEINEQSEAYVIIFRDLYNDETLPIFHKALFKWGYDGEILVGSSTINWRMVKHEMEEQIKAKKAIE